MPLMIYIGVICYLEVGSIFALGVIPYIVIWLVLFQIILSRVFEVMVIFKDRVLFINPYKTKTVHLKTISSIYYRSGSGLSFHDSRGAVYKPGFEFDMENHLLEMAFQVISEFIEFDEEHIKDSKTYCLVNSRITASQR